jgi:hypothetical protein
MEINQPKSAKLKKRGCKLKWCKLVRSVKAKRHKTNGCETRPWSTGKITAVTAVVIVMTSLCHDDTGDDTVCARQSKTQCLHSQLA